MTYINQINTFQNNDDIITTNKNNYYSMDNYLNNNFFEEQFNELKDELNISLNTIHFVNAYCFNKLENILIELLKLFPEFIIFNTKNLNVYDYASKSLRRFIFVNLLNFRGRYNKSTVEKEIIIFKDRENYYKKLETIIDFFIHHSKYNNEALFVKFIFPFLINHGYFYFKLDKYFPKNSEEIKLFFDLSLNNYNLLSNINRNQNIEKIIENNTDYTLYYLCFILRIGITDFITNRNKEILKKFLFAKYRGFALLYKLTDNLVKK